MNFTQKPKNDSTRLKAISDQSHHLYGATVYVFDCVMTTAFGVKGELVVMANSKLPKAERTAQIREVISRFRQGERLEVSNA
jgi:hypothetical protein